MRSTEHLCNCFESVSLIVSKVGSDVCPVSLGEITGLSGCFVDHIVKVTKVEIDI